MDDIYELRETFGEDITLKIGGGGVVYPLDVTAFNQSVSDTNLVTNGDMETGSPPTGWTAGTDSTVAADADAHGGSQSLLVTRNGAQTTNFAFRSISTTVGKWYLCDGWMKIGTATQIRDRIISSTSSHNLPPDTLLPAQAGEWVRGERCFRARATSATWRALIITNADTQTGLHDDKRMRLMTLNDQMEMPSPNAEIEVFPNLPSENTYTGQFLQIHYRIQGDLESEANYWYVHLYRNSDNDDWSFLLVSVADGVETQRASMADIGTPDSLIIRCYGTKHQVYVVLDGIETPLHSVVELDHVTSATGLNVIYSESMTPARLRSRPSLPFDGLSGQSIVFIDGDSKSDPTASFGYWDFMFQYRAQKRTGKMWSIINVADGGNTLDSCVSQLPDSLAALDDEPQPDVALLNVGANDVENAFWMNETNWKNNLRNWIDTFHAKFPDTPIHVARTWREDYDDNCDLLATWIADVVAEYTFAFLGMDERVWFKDAPELWYADHGVHYNGAGNIKCALEWEANVFG
jgi:hypothetical protein